MGGDALALRTGPLPHIGQGDEGYRTLRFGNDGPRHLCAIGREVLVPAEGDDVTTGRGRSTVRVRPVDGGAGRRARP